MNIEEMTLMEWTALVCALFLFSPWFINKCAEWDEKLNMEANRKENMKDVNMVRELASIRRTVEELADLKQIDFETALKISACVDYVESCYDWEYMKKQFQKAEKKAKENEK